MFNWRKQKRADNSQGDLISNFWKWFCRNSNKFYPDASLTPEKIVKTGIFDQLRKVHPQLAYELGLTPTGKADFIISAEGNIENFDLVFEMIKQAPLLEGWQFTALKPPFGFDFKYEDEVVELNPTELCFGLMTAEGTDMIGVSVHIPKFDASLKAHYVASLWRIIETGLGEWLTSRMVAYVNADAIPISEEAAYPLKELGTVVQHYMKKAGIHNPYETRN